MAPKTLNVLFVCERNSVRSIMAEALLNRFSDGRFRAFSADLEPAKELPAPTLDILQASNLPTANLKPRNLSEFTAQGAPKMDFVISMGNGLAAALRELPGNPMRAHWGISDPFAGEGDPVAQKFALRRAFRELENRIRLFVLVRHDRDVEPVRLQRQAQQNL